MQECGRRKKRVNDGKNDLNELGKELGCGALLRAVSEVDFWLKKKDEHCQCGDLAGVLRVSVFESSRALTEFLDAVLALVTLALLNALGALVKVVLEGSAGFGLLALCWCVNQAGRENLTSVDSSATNWSLWNGKVYVPS